MLWVSGRSATAIRIATNRPGRVITICAPENLGGVIAPDAIAITPDSRTVYVSCPRTVVPVRAGADTASQPIRVSSAGALAMAAEGRTVYVANPGGDTITPISTATDEPGQPIVVGPSPDAMAVTPDGRTVLVHMNHRLRYAAGEYDSPPPSIPLPP